MTEESRIQAQSRAVFSGRDATTRVWRNNVGGGKLAQRDCKYCQQNGRWIDWGLQTGSSDLIGIHRHLITQEEVGKYIGRFFCVEIKTPTGRLSKEQKIWAATIRSFDGIAETCRSKDDAIKILGDLG